MGVYVNPRNNKYRRAINDDIYIDKSDLIAVANHRLGKANCYMCVSRPRRFGKSMAADMLVAYYSKNNDSHELFKGKKIEKDASFEKHLNQHDVIRIDVQQFILDRDEIENTSEKIQSAVVKELIEEFPDIKGLSIDMDMQMVLNRIFDQSGTGFVFIIDEWDCVFRMARENVKAQQKYLDFIRNLFKEAAYVDLVYMTGILPIKKYGEHSAINMFQEYSMTSPKGLETYFGFTEEEVRKECLKHQMGYERMQEWYDGYTLNGVHIYNPKSVVDALYYRKIESYWTGTETYEALKVYIDRNFDGLKEAIIEMLAGGKASVDPTTFKNDMTTFKSKDDVLTLLVHLGYLTYDQAYHAVLIPNQEIKEEFIRAIKVGSEWGNLMRSLDRSLALLENTWALEADKVAQEIDAIHEETTSIIQYNNENSLACVLYIAYYSASSYYANPIAELPTGKGFADIVYLPLKNVNKPALVVELKWNESTQGAIQQIKEKHYTKWIESYTGDILLVGINYDKKTKKHQCAIEHFEVQ